MVGERERELWDPEAQSVPDPQAGTELRHGLADAWQRVWDLPIPFYRDRFEAAGFRRDSMPALDDIPRTTKADLRENEAQHPPFGTHRSVALTDAARIAQTTGTTGTPWLIFYSATDLDTMLEMQYQHTWRVGLRPGGRFSLSWPGGMYPTGVLGGRHFLRLGVLELQVGPPFSVESAKEHIRLWQLLEPTAFMCTGSQLQIYETAAAEMGVDLRSITEGASLVFLEASCQFEGPRRRIEDALGVRLHNSSGAAEVPGFVTSDCHHHTGFHVPPRHYVIQVCDPETGREVADGERGTLVVSTVGLDAFYLRYDLEDIVVRQDGPCPCGQTGPRYVFVGRGADAVKLGSERGRMVMPLDIQLALHAFGSPEFVLQAGVADAVLLRIESEGQGDDMRAAIAAAVDAPVEVEEIPVGTLPRSTFKPRRIT